MSAASSWANCSGTFVRCKLNRPIVQELLYTASSTGQLFTNFCSLQTAWANCSGTFVRCKLHGQIVHEILFAATCMGKLFRGFWLLQAAGDWLLLIYMIYNDYYTLYTRTTIHATKNRFKYNKSNC